MATISGIVYNETGAPANGRVVRAYRRDTGALLGQSLTGSSSVVTSRYWRIEVVSNNGSGYMGIGELYLTAQGVDLDTSGKTYSQSAFTLGLGASFMFNGSLSSWDNSWLTSSAQLPAWGQIDMGSTVSVDSIGIALGAGQGASEAPQAFSIQYSADGSAWSTALSVTGQTGWSVGAAGRRNYSLSQSLADGAYSLTVEYSGECNVVCLDDATGTVYNDLILRTTPV